MAKISPFKAYCYNQKTINKLEDVIVPPYDQISPEKIDSYYQKSEYNLCRIIQGLEKPDDNKNCSKYTRAAEYLHKWIQKGVLCKENKDAIFIYDQTYTGLNGQKITRNSFIAAGQLTDFDKGDVSPHEKTLAGPKKDRLALTEATKTAFGLIFMLYTDNQKNIDRLIESIKSKGQPDIRLNDEAGELHQVWIENDRDTIAEFSKLMSDKKLMIADGHHRYETAINFQNKMHASNHQTTTHAHDKTMMCFVNTASHGLTIFPFHRAVHSLPSFNIEKLMNNISKHFTIKKTTGHQLTTKKIDDTLAALKSDNPDDLNFAFIPNQGGDIYLINARISELLPTIKKLAPQKSSAWQELDIAILHTLILDNYLGIDEQKLAAKTNITYIKYTPEILSFLNGEGNGIFLVNPTRVEQVIAVAEAGDKMPQKSTNFYPKVLTGLTIYKMDE